MSKPKIIISIDSETGEIVNLSSNTDMEIVVVHYDDNLEDGVFIYGPIKQDDLFRDGKAYKLIEDRDISIPISEEETEVIIHLKECKF